MMAEFINVPPLEIGDSPEQWILHEECIYQSDLPGDDGKPVLVTVPVGFVTDLASVPRVFRLLIPKNGRHRSPAIIHDYLCRLKLEFSRVTADKIFREGMKVEGVPGLRRWAMYSAVRLNTARMQLIRKAR